MPKELFSAEELAQVDAIHDDPRNDGPRLAYADWLETHGLSGFAEFIHIQCREPYFALVKQGDEEPRVSHDTYRIKFDDPGRSDRAIELLRGLHNTDRFPDVNLWQEYCRGLPVYEEETDDESLRYSVTDLCGMESPLARFRLFVRTARLADWLAHPIIRFLDELRIFPNDPENNGSAEFTEDDILLLERFPLLDRLEQIGLSGPVSDEVLRLVRERLEPRVSIDYDY